MSARVITMDIHPFGYDEDIVLSRDGSNEAASILTRADWIISSGDSNYQAFEKLLEQFGIRRHTVNLGIRHGGTGYRSDPERCNDLDRNYWGFKRVFVAPDLYRFVKDDSRSRIYVQPQDYIAENVGEVGQRVRICHGPSDRRKKGTQAILEAMWQYDEDTVFEVIENLSHTDFYRRMASHHVLIEQYAPAIGGYGATAMEALANGLAVISSYPNVVREVERWVSIPPILPINSVEEIRDSLYKLVHRREELQRQRQRSLAWAQTYLCPEFTYEYWRRCLTSDE